MLRLASGGDRWHSGRVWMCVNSLEFSNEREGEGESVGGRGGAGGRKVPCALLRELVWIHCRCLRRWRYCRPKKGPTLFSVVLLFEECVLPHSLRGTVGHFKRGGALPLKNSCNRNCCRVNYLQLRKVKGSSFFVWLPLFFFGCGGTVDNSISYDYINKEQKSIYN